MLPTLAPQNMTEAMEFSKILATSNMVPAGLQGKATRYPGGNRLGV
jgi:hypothetical protein